jgi:hypothetical protein
MFNLLHTEGWEPEKLIEVKDMRYITTLIHNTTLAPITSFDGIMEGKFHLSLMPRKDVTHNFCLILEKFVVKDRTVVELFLGRISKNDSFITIWRILYNEKIYCVL